MENLLEIFFGYIMADFLVGVFHWMKDTYGTPHTPLIGKKIIWSSRLHHVRPQHVTSVSDFDLLISSGSWTMLWYIPYVLLFGLSLFNISLFLTISINDIIHKYAHMNESTRPKLISFLQDIIIQSDTEHHVHHTFPHTQNYCPITPFLNKILETINFWRRLEGLAEKILNISPRLSSDEFVEIDDSAYVAGIKFLKDDEIEDIPLTPRDLRP